MRDLPSLRVAVGRYPHTEALHTGEVVPAGVDLDLVAVDPIIAAFRSMVRDLAYDVCELAPTTYLVAREAGVPIVALPVFLLRRFHHADVLCRTGSGIEEPADLAGRSVGVRAWSVTTGVWVRGLLAREHGLDHRTVEWFVDDDEHVASFRLPGNVHRLPPGDSLAQAFADGRIDAALGGRAGIGRSGAPRAGWSAGPAVADHHALFGDGEVADEHSYATSGIYPLHGLVCVRAELLHDRPWLAGALCAAFTGAKQRFLDTLPAPDRDGAGLTGEAARYQRLRARVGPDPLPYGLEPNRPTLTALVDFALEQELITRRPELDELFAPVR